MFIGLSLIYVFLNIVTSIFLRLLVGLFSRRHGRHVLISVSICVYFRLYVAFSGISPSPYQSLIFFMYVHEEKRYGTYQSLRGKEGFPPVLIGLFLVCIRFSYFVKCFFLRLKVFLIIFFCSLRQSRYRSLPRVYLFLLVHDILIERNPPGGGGFISIKIHKTK